jgi:hypothetical protein
VVCRKVFPKNLSFDIVRMSPVIKMWIVESNVSLPFVVLTGYRRNFLFYYFPFHIPTRLAYADDDNILGGSRHVYVL